MRRGDTPTGHELAQQLHQTWLARLGPDDHRTLRMANNLAEAWRGFARYQQARELDEDILERRGRVLGPDHPDTLDSANNLARDLRALGQDEAARQLEADASREHSATGTDDSTPAE